MTHNENLPIGLPAKDHSELVKALKSAGINNRPFREWGLNSQLSDARQLLTSSLESMESNFQETCKKTGNPPEDLTQEQLELYHDQLASDAFAFTVELPNLVREITFIHLYSIIEKNMLLVAEIVHKNSPSKYAPSERNRNPDNPLRNENGVTKYKKFLAAYPQINFPDGSEWNEILVLGLLRNRLSHAQDFCEVDEHLKLYVTKKSNWEFLKLTDDGDIVIKEGFCEHVSKITRQFFQPLFSAIPDPLFD